jgi:vacuolar-type H+-ATPase subunit E/Vma4
MLGVLRNANEFYQNQDSIVNKKPFQLERQISAVNIQDNDQTIQAVEQMITNYTRAVSDL